MRALLFQEAQNNFQTAKTAFENKEYPKAYIYFFQAHLLYREVIHP